MLELAHEIQELIEAEARDVIASGWAEIRVEEGEIGPSIHLEPVKLESAPLEVYFDSDELVVCTAGRHGMSCEFFSQDPDEIKQRVRALAVAVVTGQFVERMRKGTSEIVAEWPGPDGLERARREALMGSGMGSGEWSTFAYDPY